MTAVTIQPKVLKDCLLTFGTDDQVASVTDVVFTPSTQVQTLQALSPAATYTDQGAPTWTLDLTVIQEWETTDALCRYLLDHEGEAVAVAFEPEVGGTSWAATVVCTPGAIGGTAGQFPTQTVSLGVIGSPVPTP